MSKVFKKTWFITVLLILIPALAFGQTIKVEGVVEDENGETLIGVSVMVKDTSTGTVTDLDGSFSLNSVKENATLVFSYIGYQTLEMPASSRMTIRLMPDTSSLDDVVVVAYGTARRKDLTGSLSEVKSEIVAIQNTSTVSRLLWLRWAMPLRAVCPVFSQFSIPVCPVTTSPSSASAESALSTVPSL